MLVHKGLTILGRNKILILFTLSNAKQTIYSLCKSISHIYRIIYLKTESMRLKAFQCGVIGEDVEDQIKNKITNEEVLDRTRVKRNLWMNV